MSIKCIIVDDEPLASEVIESYLQDFPDIEIAAKCENAISAFDIIKRKKIDLVFLDIQMPRINGIDFIKTLQNPPKIIITTAYREYALDGYDLNVIDYLLKPISLGRFIKAIDKFYLQYQTEKPQMAQIINTSASFSINVRSERKMVKINTNDIFIIESLKDYVIIHKKDKKIITKNQISYFEEILPADKFIRIHKSYIVELSKIEAFTPTTVEILGKELPIGRNYKNETLKRLNG
ncbi:MAG: LytR/AlgR family response regulator transcription factor [Ignavibacteriaceae bacterium]